MISTNPIGQAAGETVRDIVSGNSPARRGRGSHRANLSDTERNISIAAGAAIGLLGLVKGSGLTRLASLGVAGALLNRGISGYCALSEKLGIESQHK